MDIHVQRRLLCQIASVSPFWKGVYFERNGFALSGSNLSQFLLYKRGSTLKGMGLLLLDIYTFIQDIYTMSHWRRCNAMALYRRQRVFVWTSCTRWEALCLQSRLLFRRNFFHRKAIRKSQTCSLSKIVKTDTENQVVYPVSLTLSPLSCWSGLFHHWISKYSLLLISTSIKTEWQTV